MARRLLDELRRRNVLRAAAVYVAIAWGATEILTFVFERFGFPDWTITLTAVLFVVGFPVAMFVEWTFDIGRAGIRRTPPGSPQGRLAIALAATMLVAGTAGLFYLINAPSSGPPDLASGEFAPPAHSIAVLPFEVIAADRKALDWLGEGFGETLLHNLAQLDALHVIARTSAFSFKDRESDVRRIGRLLNVATILEGSIQKADGMLRITAQLIDARDGAHLWSGSYDRPDSNVFEIQDEISAAVAAKLLDTLAPTRPATPRPDSAAAYDLYLLGRHHWHKRTAEAIGTAIGYFREAIRLDPDYALAYSGLADALAVLSDYTAVDAAEVAGRAMTAAQTAVTLAPQLAEAHASVGLVHMQLGDYAAADAAFERAMALQPNYAMAHLWHGRSLQLRHRYAEAVVHHRQALELDPLAPIVNLNLAVDLQWLGWYPEAVQRFQRTIELSPDMANAHFGMAVVRHRHGALADALDAYRKAQALGRVTTLTVRELALLYVDLELDSEADATLERARQIADDLYVYYARKLALMARGEAAEIVRLAEAALEAQPDQPVYLADAGLGRSRLDDCARALEYYERLQALAPSGPPLFERWDLLYGYSHALAMLSCYRQLGRNEAAAALAADIRAFRDSVAADGLGGPPIDYFDAQLAALEGQAEPAFTYLERAIDGGFRQHRLARHEPALAALHGDVRFEELMQRVAELVAEERAKIEVP